MAISETLTLNVQNKEKWLQGHVLHSLVVKALKISALLVDDYISIIVAAVFLLGRFVRKQYTCKLNL